MSLPVAQNHIVIPFLSDVQLEKTAADFLAQYGYGKTMPIDIERLCDEVGISILAVPSLFEELNVDAYIADGCRVIVIDEHCFCNFPNRTRFSIAHELSHYILHREFYLSQGINSIESYMSFQSLVQDESHKKRIELQAHILAGHLLMPRALLNKQITVITSEIYDGREMSPVDAAAIADRLSRLFEVSSEALYRQLNKIAPELYKKLS